MITQIAILLYLTSIILMLLGAIGGVKYGKPKIKNSTKIILVITFILMVLMILVAYKVMLKVNSPLFLVIIAVLVSFAMLYTISRMRSEPESDDPRRKWPLLLIKISIVLFTITQDLVIFF
jgi:ABC-type transport system involved in cytochrome c biogenesis permease subunit